MFSHGLELSGHNRSPSPLSVFALGGTDFSPAPAAQPHPFAAFEQPQQPTYTQQSPTSSNARTPPVVVDDTLQVHTQPSDPSRFFVGGGNLPRLGSEANLMSPFELTTVLQSGCLTGMPPLMNTRVGSPVYEPFEYPRTNRRQSFRCFVDKPEVTLPAHPVLVPQAPSAQLCTQVVPMIRGRQVDENERKLPLATQQPQAESHRLAVSRTLLARAHKRSGHANLARIDPHAVVCGRLSLLERYRLIKRFQYKKNRRSFTKKIMYRCRKRFADKRPRVGGRFVKIVKTDPVVPPTPKKEFPIQHNADKNVAHAA